MGRSSQAFVGIASGIAWLVVAAAPLAAPELRPQMTAPSAEVGPAENPVDVHLWIQREASHVFLDSAVEAGRLDLLRQGWRTRAPTWIQDGSVVNLGDYPGLDDSALRAERDLKTLEWVIEEQRKLALGLQGRDAVDADVAPAERWLQRLLPPHWISTLKANREWVTAGGTVLLVIVWGSTVFARRPSANPPVVMAAEPTPAKKRRRHRHRHRRVEAG